MTVKDTIQELSDLMQGSRTKRFDCPFCGCWNTLSLTREDGVIKYNCFDDGCKTNGIISEGDTVDGAKLYINNRLNKVSESNQRRKTFKFSVPDTLTYNITEAEKYFKKYNCLEAYEKGLVELRYDILNDRAVFMVRNPLTLEIEGAVGRSLSNSSISKVWNYHNQCTVPFIVGEGGTAVIVEDCASACSVGRLPEYTGFSLMGTKFKKNYLTFLKKYATVIIYLDKDAYKTALELKKKLNFYVQNVRILLRQDSKEAKHFKNKDELLKVLQGEN